MLEIVISSRMMFEFFFVEFESAFNAGVFAVCYFKRMFFCVFKIDMQFTKSFSRICKPKKIIIKRNTRTGTGQVMFVSFAVLRIIKNGIDIMKYIIFGN